MKKWMLVIAMFFFGGFIANAQYGGYNGPDRYFYEDEFDWRWDIRVRISDGYNAGYLTRREANRLYNRLEEIERREWAFQADGYYSPWEQDEIWYDIVDLNRWIGIELSDWDRRYYGYTGVALRGGIRFYFGNTYDFYRFDRLGYGTMRVGYAPRVYVPTHVHVYYNHRNNYHTNWNNTTVINNARSGRTVSARNSVNNSSRVVDSRASSGVRGNTNSRVNTPSRNSNMESSSRGSGFESSSRSGSVGESSRGSSYESSSRNNSVGTSSRNSSVENSSRNTRTSTSSGSVGAGNSRVETPRSSNTGSQRVTSSRSDSRGTVSRSSTPASTRSSSSTSGTSSSSRSSSTSSRGGSSRG